MADGDYERGRSHEIAAIAARLKRLAASRPGILVLNGWAASPRAWDLCRFVKRPNCRLLSYLDQLRIQNSKLRIVQGAGAGGAGGAAPRPFDQNHQPPTTNHQPPTTNHQPGTIITGWSMGGCMALKLACEFPERIAGLVLVAATPRMMAAEGWRGMSERRLEALRKGLEMTHGEGFFGVPEGKPNPYMTDAPENLERGLKFLLETDIRADLERVFKTGGCKFPVHIFQSERDGIVRAENAEYLKTIFPHAHVTIVPGCEHALPIIINKEIDEAVDSCLAVAAKG